MDIEKLDINNIDIEYIDVITDSHLRQAQGIAAMQYADFEQTPLGQDLYNLVFGDAQTRLVEFRAFSREGFPAVTALVTEVASVLARHSITEAKDRNYAKQSVGDFVARAMRGAGYEKVGQRSVPGKTFTSGAVWKPKDQT